MGVNQREERLTERKGAATLDIYLVETVSPLLIYTAKALNTYRIERVTKYCADKNPKKL
jgi:hypothetical protein